MGITMTTHVPFPEVLARLCRESRGDRLRDAVVGLASATYAEAPLQTVRDLQVQELLDARITRPTAQYRGRHPQSDTYQFVAVVLQVGPTDQYTQFAALELDEMRAALARGLTPNVFSLTPLACHYAAAQQVERVPIYVGHGDHVRTSSEFAGFADVPRFDAATGLVLARLNIRRDNVQRRIMRALSDGQRVPLSPQFTAYYRAGLDVLLFRQLESIDLVEAAALPQAGVLGPWADRAAILDRLGVAWPTRAIAGERVASVWRVPRRAA